MLIAAFISLIPIAILVIGHFMHPREITFKEILVGFVAAFLINVGSYVMFKNGAMTFDKVIVGEIQNKHLNMRYYHEAATYNENGTVKTPEREGYDMEWIINTTIGDILLDQVDCTIANKSWCNRKYGSTRWDNARIGEPASRLVPYVNYPKAAKFSLFNVDDGMVDPAQYPKYPGRGLYDVYKSAHTVTHGVKIKETGGIERWNETLKKYLAMGKSGIRGSNIIVVFTASHDISYASKLYQAWEGANANDVVIVAGFPTGEVTKTPEWVSVTSWSRGELNTGLRDFLMNPARVDWNNSEATVQGIAIYVNDMWNPQPMEEFKYLANEIEPGTLGYIGMVIVSILSGLGLCVLFHKAEIFKS